MGSTAKTTIQSVGVIRPVKVCAILCIIISIILLILALIGTTWIKAGGYRTGLFHDCTEQDAEPPLPPQHPLPGKCKRVNTSGRGYILATAIIMITAAVCSVSSVILNTSGLMTSSPNRKYLYYRAALFLLILSVLLKLIGLIVFPVCIYSDLKSYNLPSWDFDWSYALAWMAVFFEFVASLLLICDKGHEEIYYKEKTIYSDMRDIN